MHTDSLAYEGIKLISQSIRTAVFDGTNMLGADTMAMGSMMGGIAFGNAGVGAVHALSYPIGGMFHVPHGVANTMVLPWPWTSTSWPACAGCARSARPWARTSKA